MYNVIVLYPSFDDEYTNMHIVGDTLTNKVTSPKSPVVDVAYLVVYCDDCSTFLPHLVHSDLIVVFVCYVC